MNTYKYFHEQMMPEDKTSVENDFNHRGRGAVLENIYGRVERDINYLLLSRTDAFEYNTIIFRVITGLQSVLDMAARFTTVRRFQR